MKRLLLGFGLAATIAYAAREAEGAQAEEEAQAG